MSASLVNSDKYLNHKSDNHEHVPVVPAPSEADTSRSSQTLEIPKRPRRRHRERYSMDVGMTEAQIHDTPVKVHGSKKCSSNQNKSNRHTKHKCHKSLSELNITKKKAEERNKFLAENNSDISKKLNCSVTSVDSGLVGDLPPFDMDITQAYQHIKLENMKLLNDNKVICTQNENLKLKLEKCIGNIKEKEYELFMMKNLVYRLNIELDKLQNSTADNLQPKNCDKQPLLPENYKKNFLKPLLPLLKAYSETIQEKNDIIDNYEKDFNRFSKTMKDILMENEKLYKELELKENGLPDVGNESLMQNNKMLKEEVTLYKQQVDLQREKIKEMQQVFKTKVLDLLKENDLLNERMQSTNAEFYILRGKYAILKETHDRMKVEEDQRIPLIVHSAAVTECKRLFFDLQKEYQSDNDKLKRKLEQSEENHSREREKLVKDLQQQSSPESDVSSHKRDKKLHQMLIESNQRREELISKLETTKTQLHKAMQFGEDLVREQENLLRELHSKQRENSTMAEKFGTLRNTIRSVEMDANRGLNSIEEQLKRQELENQELSSEVKKLREELKEKDVLIHQLQVDVSSPI